MSTYLQFVPLVLTLLFYAWALKLAAWLFRRASLRWGHAVLQGVMSLLLGVVGSALLRSGGSAWLPLLGLLVGVALQLGLGGWYLGSRARRATGEAVGFKVGMAIMAIALGLLFVFSGLLWAVSLSIQTVKS